MFITSIMIIGVETGNGFNYYYFRCTSEGGIYNDYS